MTNPVTHFEIMGKDSAALQKFYHEVFGWKLAPPVKEMGNYSLFDNEGQGIGGGIGDGDARVTVYIEVDDPQAYLDKVTALGGRVVMPVTDLGMVVMCQFADPEGNIVGIVKAGQQ